MVINGICRAESGAARYCEARSREAALAGLSGKAGDAEARLALDDPANPTIRRLQYRQTSDGAAGQWTDILSSGDGRANEDDYTVTGISNGTGYNFAVRVRRGRGERVRPGF